MAPLVFIFRMMPFCPGASSLKGVRLSVVIIVDHNVVGNATPQGDSCLPCLDNKTSPPKCREELNPAARMYRQVHEPVFHALAPYNSYHLYFLARRGKGKWYFSCFISAYHVELGTFNFHGINIGLGGALSRFFSAVK